MCVCVCVCVACLGAFLALALPSERSGPAADPPTANALEVLIHFDMLIRGIIQEMSLTGSMKSFACQDTERF